MSPFIPYSINCGGRLIELARPQVMGILNVTPDSFYAGSRKQTEAEIESRVREILEEGGTMIDIGAYSSRSGADDVSPEEEMARLRRGLQIVRRLAPDVPVSVDTFRADVARMCVEECGADIINDISGGTMDNNMFRTVASLRVPYILMHMRGTPQDMQEYAKYDDVTAAVLAELGERLGQLSMMGVNDVIVDPGFGFAKTLEQNYELLGHMDLLHLLHRPLLVGVSRKSMATRLLGITADDALEATTALNTLALTRGAAILRVHDVKAAAHAVAVYNATAKWLN